MRRLVTPADVLTSTGNELPLRGADYTHFLVVEGDQTRRLPKESLPFLDPNTDISQGLPLDGTAGNLWGTNATEDGVAFFERYDAEQWIDWNELPFRTTKIYTGRSALAGSRSTA
jgi:hypothetical protein